ncbi:MAG: uL15 family ribosomal protein, partial [Anaeroplasmataceae bacterium]|nr:uL15 family ribosomal protein [Anaeroplasmataceae bacterium]
DALIKAGLIKDTLDGVKVLGQGELTKKLTVKVNKISKSAQSAIENAGGAVEVI